MTHILSARQNLKRDLKQGTKNLTSFFTHLVCAGGIALGALFIQTYHSQAQESFINDLMTEGGDEQAPPFPDTRFAPSHNSPHQNPAPRPAPSYQPHQSYTPSVTSPSAASPHTSSPALPKARPELWVTGKKAVNHLQVISVHPLPGESCQNVIFDARPSLKKRHEPQSGSTLNFDIKSLCLLGLRNDDKSRPLVVRLGEVFETLAIVVNPRLFTGLVLGPDQQVMIPIRPLPVGQLKIPLEVVWKSELNRGESAVNKLALQINEK